MNVRRTVALSVLMLTVVTAFGCTSSSSSSRTASGPKALTPGTVANPTDFPLAANDKILDAKPFNQVVASSSSSGTVLAQGAGTYAGHSVIAQSAGTLADAKLWLVTVEHAPPAGYEYVASAAHPSAISTAARYGVTYAVFRNGKKAAVIAVIDPKVAHDQLGEVLTALSDYQMLPAALRGSIDQQVKSKIGVSPSDALDPSAPLGMTLQALKTVNGSGDPAIVVVDATKQ